ncbi:MAG: RNA polymerase sigma factor [Candidatus Krumholzibacteriota bacterium]|nr:RNA polymerase sigma factor [Candidatus Krumholzibacteriota bacterium]
MTEKIDDAQLMRLVSGGDTEAFRVLVRRYQSGVYNYFLRSTGSVEDAEDLCQQLFVVLYTEAGRYLESASFRTYLYRIAYNLAVSFSRKRRAKGALSLEQLTSDRFLLSSSGENTDPAGLAEYNELLRAYSEALFGLPPAWRMALELKITEGFSYEEISRIMGKSVSAVESILFRARRRLAEELKAFRRREIGT